MRYLVISDIHANLEAYETVMATAAALNYERVLVLGDLVGYGADRTRSATRARPGAAGADSRNHDKVGSGVESPRASTPCPQRHCWTYDA